MYARGGRCWATRRVPLTVGVFRASDATRWSAAQCFEYLVISNRLTSHRFSLLPEAYSVVQLEAAKPVPAWAVSANGFVCITRTPDELSIVCPASGVPLSVRAEGGWRVLKLHGPFPFDAVGVLASFAAPLARAEVSVFAVSTFDTDYLLIKDSQIGAALRALESAGHTLVD